MHAIVIASYLTAAAAFLVACVLLAIGWHGRRTGALLVLAAAVTAAWGVFLAYAEQRQALPVAWLLLAETLRYGAWLAFVGALFSGWPMTGLLRGMRVGAHAVWVVVALYCLAAGAGWLRILGHRFDPNLPLVGVLVLALAGVVFLEQIYRNVNPERRWALKFLMLGLGVMFAYDIFLYSYAVLYRQFDVSAWAARGFIDALVAPLLVVAAARNQRAWSLDVGVSRKAVFYSSSLLVVAFYIIATAVGGYYVRLYGGDWGRVAEITLVCFALLVVGVLATSGQARSRLRVFLQKNFFSYRHDYREEWLRLTATLSESDDDAGLPLRAVRAVAQTMDSPAGALLLCDDARTLLPAAGMNLTLPPDVRVAADAPVFRFMRERRWIYDLAAPPPLGDAGLKAPAALVALPRAWLLVPLVLHERLVGVVLLARARAPRKLDWEDIDLLRTAGTQVAAALVQAANARRLAEARQFEGFNRLTAFLMHDLKNVAGQQSLLLQNAERHKRNPAFVDDMLATVANSVHRIGHVLEQLRGGGQAVEAGRVQIQAVVARALVECQAQAPRPEWQPPAEPLWVRADAAQLATVLGHVIRNAQDAATAHGHVSVHLTQAGSSARLEVEDDGAGMDAAFIRERLFQPFFTTKASRGMGIGAYQAREYVRSLGGSVDVASTPGEGTLFAIHLPLADPVAIPAVAGKVGVAS
ncbi:MAG TPA: XrtA/PEP-CTERM system histidine kinase PrsK [Rhodanobacteraceae bacterium]